MSGSLFIETQCRHADIGLPQRLRTCPLASLRTFLSCPSPIFGAAIGGGHGPPLRTPLSSYSCKTSVTSLLQQLQLESLEERRKIQRLAFMYKILNGQVAVPATSVDHTLSSRPSRGANANQQKLVTVRSYTENYRQSYSIRTVKDWNSLSQSVMSASSLALFKSRLSSHVAP